MYKYLLLSLSSLVSASSYEYHMKMSFKRGSIPHQPRIEYRVNKQDVYCACGNKPVMSIFTYGEVEHYCQNHVPEIEHVTRITEDNLQQLLDSLRYDPKLSNCSQCDKK